MSDSKFDELVNSGEELPVTTKEEAASQGFTFYWTGKPCMKGHRSKRTVCDAKCVACNYLSVGHDARQRAVSESRTTAAEMTIGVRKQQVVLEAYAKSSSIEDAAKSIGMTVPQLNVQMARNLAFSAKMGALEKRLRVSKQNQEQVYSHKDVEWTDEMRATFIRAYIDTGDMSSARDAIGVSPSNYFDEIERNPDFSDQVKAAGPKAMQALEEKAIQLARNGNDKLITLVLKARIKEYGDKITIDQNTNTLVRISDDRLNGRITELLGKYRVIDGSNEHGTSGQGAVAGLIGRDRPETDAGQVPLSVPGHGTATKGTIHKAS